MSGSRKSLVAAGCSVFDQLEVIMCRWRDIERRLLEPAPVIYAATRTQLRQISLS
ncbi:MAG TPA: hypothetical protein VGJ07_10710 [Rugosimonospora sp.]|jgi:hypothetical protein